MQHPLSEHFVADYAIAAPDSCFRCLPHGFNTDIILVSVSGEQRDSDQIIERLRTNTRSPIVVVSADWSVSACCRALLSGADDYMTRPVNYRELAARMEAILRRVRPGTHEHCLRLRGGDLVISQTAREVRLQGRSIALTPTEFDLLWELATNPGQAVSREHLHTRVWSGRNPGGLRTVDSHMAHLRRALNQSEQWIETVFRVGYRFVEEPAARKIRKRKPHPTT